MSNYIIKAKQASTGASGYQKRYTIYLVVPCHVEDGKRAG